MFLSRISMFSNMAYGSSSALKDWSIFPIALIFYILDILFTLLGRSTSVTDWIDLLSLEDALLSSCFDVSTVFSSSIDAVMEGNLLFLPLFDN